RTARAGRRAGSAPPRSRGPGTASCRSSRRRARRTPPRPGACWHRRSRPRRAPRAPTGPAARPRVASATRSVGVLVRPDPNQREKDDLDVEREAPILDVVEVVDEPLLHGGLAAQVLGLRPARQARPHEVAQLIY